MCPTCGDEMKCLSLVLSRGPYWCPQCGTIGSLSPEDNPQWNVPTLLERCREFEKRAIKDDPDGWFEAAWNHLGIAESIHKPEERS